MKRKIVYYTATSLDFYLAGENGEIDWLFYDNDYGYYDFIKTIDTTLMGRKTLEVIESFKGEFPYKGFRNYAFSRNDVPGNNPYINYVAGDVTGFVHDLKDKEGKDIWLIGGGEIAGMLMNNFLIDEIILSIHPVILGKGIPVFANLNSRKNFIVSDSKVYDSGLTQLHLQLKG